MSQLVGGQFDLEMNFIIQEPESIGCMVELLDKCEPTCQAEVWSIFTAILKKSVRNLQACTEVGLIQQVLDRITTTDSMIAGEDAYCCFNLCFTFGGGTVEFYKYSFMVYKMIIALVMVHANRHQCLAQPPSFLSLLPICKLVRINLNVLGSVNPRQNAAGLEGLCRRAGVVSASSNCWVTRIFSSKFPHRLKEALM